MRVLQLVSAEKWTGAAAVVFEQTAALLQAGIEAQFGFIGKSPLEKRLLPLGWARPLLVRPRGPLDYPREIGRLRETLRRERFDIVHTHLSHDHYLAALAVRGTPVRLARTFHHLSHLRRDPLSRALFHRTQAFAFANLAIREKFGADGPVHSPVVNPQRFCPGGKPREILSRFAIPEDRFLVGTVGKIDRGRGYETAVDAVAPLPARVCLLQVGMGPLQPALQKRAESLGLSQRNYWTGYQEELLPELYRAMDCFLFTAPGSQQGHRAILEAMASGVPVVAADLPGVRDLVTHGREGLIVESGEGLSKALVRLLESPEERARLAKNGRKRALEFRGESFARRAVDFYQRLARPA